MKKITNPFFQYKKFIITDSYNNWDKIAMKTNNNKGISYILSIYIYII